jgi:hypothetical protein
MRVYLSDRGRLFQADRGRRFNAIVDGGGCALQLLLTSRLGAPD